MSKYSVKLSNWATKDIRENADYIAFDKQSPEAALQLSRGFYKQIKSLSINPHRHSLDEDEVLSSLQIRRHYFKNYKIYYQINEEEKTVYIVRVLHMLVDAKTILIRMLEP